MFVLVRVVLNKLYIFVVLVLLIVILGVIMVVKMFKDIFFNVDIFIIVIVW